MTGPTHILIGIAAVTSLGHATGILPSRFELGLVILGSVLPDVDGNGMVCRLLPLLNTASSLIRKTFGHRCIFHWLFLPFLIMAAAPFGGSAFFWLGFGYLSHLLADSLTMSGIPAQPLCRRLSAKLIRTGSWAEGILFVILLVGTIRSGLLLLPPQLQAIATKAMTSLYPFTHNRLKLP